MISVEVCILGIATFTESKSVMIRGSFELRNDDKIVTIDTEITSGAIRILNSIQSVPSTFKLVHLTNQCLFV